MKKTDSSFLRIPTQIDRSSPIPLYYQIAEAILEIVEKDHLKPNDQIPSEEQLGQIFGVSKMTVRQALAKLVRDGLLERRQGFGTFVAEKKIERKATRLVSFFEDIQKKGMVPGSRVIEKKIVTPSKQVMEKLRVDEDEEVFKITRLRFANGMPLAVNCAYIPERLCPHLLEEELGHGSLSELVEKRYRLYVEYAVQNIQAVRATSYEASLLGIEKGDPLLLMERTMFDRDNLPVSYYVNWIRGDKYIFTSTLYR
ncbi:MAG: GntR family transcriptional regulator [Deltaproteobacteria bacterium]|nr:GntR family transcriptional regulator [Deltaproteobacteria bacterium]